jgi:hypothetical protein
MIAALFGSVSYWSMLIIGLVTVSRLLTAKIFDFRFMICLVLVQYAAASTIIFGPLSEISLFCTSFLILFVVTLKFGKRFRKDPFFPNSFRTITSVNHENRLWVDVSRFYILAYYAARLLFYPYVDGALLLDQRLDAQHDNAIIFYAGLAVIPAFAACMTKWVRTIGLLDIVIISVAVIGLLGSGSKGVVLPILLIFFGVMSYYSIPLRTKVWGLVLASFGGILMVYRLALYFPGYSLWEVISLFFYRIIANTDSLEYLHASGTQPAEYPYRGIGALFPMLSKQLGYRYEYSPGVWLHGIRFGDWSGFGPNPGPVMDYFGNVGWFGLLFAVALGVYVSACERREDSIGASFLAIASLIVVDITLFQVSAAVWLCIFGIVKAIASMRASRHPLQADYAQVRKWPQGPQALSDRQN